MTLYLSGPMTGMPFLNKPSFERAAALLRAQGHIVLNPHEIDQAAKLTWQVALRIDLKVILAHPDCGLVMLPRWEISRGACLERHVAEALGHPIFHLIDEELVKQ